MIRVSAQRFEPWQHSLRVLRKNFKETVQIGFRWSRSFRRQRSNKLDHFRNWNFFSADFFDLNSEELLCMFGLQKLGKRITIITSYSPFHCNFSIKNWANTIKIGLKRDLICITLIFNLGHNIVAHSKLKCRTIDEFRTNSPPGEKHVKIKYYLPGWHWSEFGKQRPPERVRSRSKVQDCRQTKSFRTNL